jgi:RNA polymerase sigma-70 factor (ECF subfamily)
MRQGTPESRPTQTALLEQVLPDVTRTCRARMPQFPDPAHGVEDAVQEIALALFRATDCYDPSRGTWAAFAHGVARNKIGDAYRSWYRIRTVGDERLAGEADTGPGPEELALRTEQTATLRGLLALLPERQRRILVMRVALGIPTAEVADELGMTPIAVRVEQHRALKLLRAAVAATAAEAA